MTILNKTYIFNNRKYKINADTITNKLTIKHGKINHVESLNPNIEKMCVDEGISFESDVKETVETYAGIHDEFETIMGAK